MGGQVGDRGVISTDKAVFTVTNVKKTPDNKWLHTGTVTEGVLNVSDSVTCQVDVARRQAIMRAHSATHMLQSALREVLGSHVEQAGSLVEPDMLRFDFTHFSAMTEEEISKVEAYINAKILAGNPITTTEMSLAQAKAAGATALFGEKYGDTVRVVSMGDFSSELCGGTHLSNTAMAGLCRIVSESSVAAGVRRIEAVTGPGVLAKLDAAEHTLRETAAAMKTNPTDTVRRATQLVSELGAANKALEQVALDQVRATANAALTNCKRLGNKVDFAVISLRDASLDNVRKLGDNLKTREGALCALFVLNNGGKLTFAAFCTKGAMDAGLHAGSLVKEIAKLTGGNGGGRPDSATAGGKDVSALAAALEAAPAIAKGMLR